MKKIAKEIIAWDFEPRLCHSDLLPKNVIVNKEGSLLSIIDWEGARSSNSVIWDLSVTLNNINPEEQKVFLEGYGMSQRKFKELEPQIRGFYILRKSDMMTQHVAKKEAKPFIALQNKFNSMLDPLEV